MDEYKNKSLDVKFKEEDLGDYPICNISKILS